LGSSSPSLESFYMTKSQKIKYEFITEKEKLPEINIINMKGQPYDDKKRNTLFSKFLIDSIYSMFNSGGKVLLLLNRKGFATTATCHNCKNTLRCPRCNINLVFHFKENKLSCHYCNYKSQPPKICPICNSGYIKYFGAGTEKIESELSRIFPQAKIKRLEGQEDINLNNADIFIATSSVIRQTGVKFDLTGVLAIDNSLNRIDLRASEKTFALLIGLLQLTGKQLIIQTNLPNHHCFQALLKKDIGLFYSQELNFRKELDFPPYNHIALIKLRAKTEGKVEEASLHLFQRLNKVNKIKGIKISSVNRGEPAKLRGNFYWQILTSCRDVAKLNTFLKINLKDFLHSGIIVTVDVDPI
jgi:primosomal protein N' (replication factor Y)